MSDVLIEDKQELTVPAQLVLLDGTTFDGFSFGHPHSTAGEVVFNTGMVGYPESLTDPSYCGQILCLTYPLVGNYGVPNADKDAFGLPKNFEGERIHPKGLLTADYSLVSSHYKAVRSLSQWLKDEGVAGITGIDTRALTKHIREHGSILGKILIGDDIKKKDSIPLYNPNVENLMPQVSRKEPSVYCTPSELVNKPGYLKAPEQITIVAVDCGMKYNIIRHFVYNLPHNIKLKVVPWDYPFGDEEFDGLFLSNGPGDPTYCEATIKNIQKVMARGKPIFGICLGNQLMALAAGAKTFKMKYGNRGMNQPVIDCRTTKCYITPQNHGYAVDPDSLPAGWMQFFVNANDKSNEGIVHQKFPWFSVQFHPESAGGPTDTSFLFYDFLRAVHDPRLIPVTTVPIQFPQTQTKVLVLGSGGLSIGQAGEFDYSGSQCIKALKEANVYSVLINPNIATVQTSEGLADKVYFLPVNAYFVEQVIAKERPDGIFCTFGGQTALNCGCVLQNTGIFEKYGVRVLGTPISAIEQTEDRDVFAQELKKIGAKCAPSFPALNVEEVVDAANKLGYPVLVRAAFALGGLGSGFASDEKQLRKLAEEAFQHSHQVLVDKSLKGWKEVEYEVVRDDRDNCITVCNMENFDPLGVHTGDSIVIAPSQTLSNEEYFMLRETAVKVIRHFGIVGECNIQYALDPNSKDFVIVEVNARLSRSSALASKATGYPLAYVAAKLGLGQDLVSIRNAVTRSTTACFEPSLDYLVAKIPRWDLTKFESVDPRMGSAMKSVGEVMAIGRTFEEVMQKALRMVDESVQGFESGKFSSKGPEEVDQELQVPTPMRIYAIARAFELGYSIEQIHKLSRVDLWFLGKLRNVFLNVQKLGKTELTNIDPLWMRQLKKQGFSDSKIAMSLKSAVRSGAVRTLRQSYGITPVVKQIDTLAAEFPATTNYLYMTYQGSEHDVEALSLLTSRNPAHLGERFRTPRPSIEGGDYSPAGVRSPPSYDRQGSNQLVGRACGLGSGFTEAAGQPMHRIPSNAALFNHVGGGGLIKVPSNPSLHPHSAANGASPRANGLPAVSERDAMAYRVAEPAQKTVLVLGCGCYRIGSSVEFDWSCMSCVKTLRNLGHKAIVVNCNPETVSTDFDESDRLYFDELSLERVLDIWEFEQPFGAVVSMGGQTPNNLALRLQTNRVKILGTSVDSIDMAEDRHKFSALCDKLSIDQPAWSAFSNFETAKEFCDRVEFPVLVRPSYVLSGAAMRVVSEPSELNEFLQKAAVVSKEHPVVISKYIENAKEVEMDAVAHDGEIVNYAISEHVENAGVHSGDATLILPAQKLYVETIRRVKKTAQKLARALRISGPFNIQFMCKHNDVKVIECNLRASRTFPFISKTFNTNFIELAIRIMIGAPFRPASIHLVDLDFVGVKAPMFSFSRLKGADPVLGVEMRSTGEVACFGTNKFDAFLKAMLATSMKKLPKEAIMVTIGPLPAKIEFLPYARLLTSLGYTIYATDGTFQFLESHGLTDKHLQKVFKPLETKEPNARTMISEKKVELVINVPDSMESKALTDGYHIRRTAIDCGVPLVTDMKLASLLVDSLIRKDYREKKQNRPFFEILAWDEYTGRTGL
uniref:Carbamoyl-phosphate synthase (glutamine-hydrolyzing) n=1 Tax=Chromera velia CCMP2878 TaxID=1169474 RepID=A0A0G4I2F1_9ALVE|mmetsp:Transcript_50102/g.98679  ORF Transcript_50102/g.98679 Transcript_50102/m.98679 type:complete len:1609 (-) Transcript_50102:2288-7114(-)|eukprot:Cvel_10392.t1-p1 / transcript=Cvel_10392.t1 / gene=Cvel_10392 / organism=Chromera_velia_CCMP2878 / gene_product=CAD protein, putative / transcript_product=CAD protein, putative / location=Cvel_scaffold626:42451-53942(-) / protein_length=1608 / sequence_SO=supercontig / SO=protein_coding / is_pseudo=false